jgi:hypothetical protein
MTDGEDTASVRPLPELITALKEVGETIPQDNFKTIFLGVDLASNIAAM